MTATYVDAITAKNGTSGVSSLASTVPTAVANGDVVVAVLALCDSSTTVLSLTVTAPTGWTLLNDTSRAAPAASQTGIRTLTYAKTVAAADHSGTPTSHSWSWGASCAATLAMVAYRGVDAAAATNATGAAEGGTSTVTHNAPAVTVPTGKTARVVGIFTHGFATTLIYTTTSGWTTRAQDIGTKASNNIEIFIDDHGADDNPGSVVATGATTATTNSTTNQAVALIVTSTGNTPPTVNAGPDLTVEVGQLVSITAAASDPDGTIATRAWTVVAGSAVAGTLSGASTATVTFTPATSGTVTLRHTATDNLGATTSDDVTVTVVNAGQYARPVADVTVTGWTPTPSTAGNIWSVLDETTVDGADYATSNSNPTGQVLTVKLSPLPVPTVFTGCYAPVWLYMDSGITSQSTLVEVLNAAGTAIASSTFTDFPVLAAPPSTTAGVAACQRQVPISAAAAAALSATDWNNLSLRVTVTAS